MQPQKVNPELIEILKNDRNKLYFLPPKIKLKMINSLITDPNG